ncbi:MAG: ATP-binding protein [Myxococcota bacterium]|nr:ATP-binding protein [Myxococcota bacterium]
MKLGIRAKLLLASLSVAACLCLLGYVWMKGKLEAEVSARAREDGMLRLLLAQRIVQQGASDAAGDQAWSELAARAAALTDSRVTLIDSAGRLLADSSGATHDVRVLSTHPEVRGQLEGRAQTPALLLSGKRLQIAAPFGAAREPRGVVRITRQVPELEAVRAAVLRYALLAFALAALLCVGFAVLASELAARPARALSKVARRMAAGDLTTRARLSRRDDLGELGRSLDQLAKNLTTSLSELRGERDRMSGILSGMVEGVLLLDASGRIVLVNPALREMFLLGQDAVGRTLLEAIRHADLKQLFDEARGSEEPVTREIETVGLKPRRLLSRFARLPSEHGQLFAVFVDVTEVRKLESMRRDFVANVSHELRTPVTAIRSAAETLQTGRPEDPATLELFLGIIDRNAARLQELVEDVLDLSRIESRELELHFEVLELGALYEQIASLFKERADRKDIQLQNLGAGKHVTGDRRALEHVLTNLVDNAVKYCGKGARVSLSASELGEQVTLSVADDGPGIEARHLPRIFERFYRVDAGRSRELGGTGLGLSIVKHLVEAQGGTVQVESRPGQGTTFSFTLKKAERGPSQPAAQAAVA